MVKKHHPRRGSLAYKPQKKAKRLYPSLSSPEDLDEGFGGFGGYKAGMTRVLRIDDERDSPTKGQEVADAVTVIECPPLRVFGARAYEMTENGENARVDVLADNIDNDLERSFPVGDGEGDLEDIDAESSSDLKLLVHTLPRGSGLGKKRPEVFELPVGGDLEDKFERASELLGTDIGVSDVFEDGQYVDVMGVTKGKGFQGPVKRHGVKKLGRKTQKSERKAGNVGPWHPDHTSWKVPLPGRMGTNNRTEYNKRILEIGEDPERVTPEGGFKNYGRVRNDYVIIKGSVPGPSKRFILFRPATRTENFPENPDVTYVKR